ncbi:hypothetical protein LguiA_028539 [Lonicera macranthoides]
MNKGTAKAITVNMSFSVPFRSYLFNSTLKLLPIDLTCPLNKKFIFFMPFIISPIHTSPLTHLHCSTETHSPLSPPLYICKSMDHIKQIQSQAIQRGLTPDTHFYSKLIAFCCTNESGNMEYARHLFDTILEPNVFMWNNLIKGYSRINCPTFAVSSYIEMLEKNAKPDHYTYPFLLKGLKYDSVLVCGKEIHAHICKFGFGTDMFVQNSLINMYSLCGQIDIARGIFEMSSKTDVITWNAMISGYNRSKKVVESRELFYAMEEKRVSPTSVTLVSVLSACTKLKDLDTVKRVNQYIKDHKIEANLILDNALIDAYSACGQMDVAFGIFRSTKIKDVISWTTIVKGFVNLGEVDLARKYFDQMPDRDFISWTAMIDGYLRLNRFKDVLMLFREMQSAEIKPDGFTVVSILTACAHLGALEIGEWIEVYSEKNKIKNDVYVGNALIDMYCKCGNVEKAVKVFNKMPRKDKFSWTAMIVGFAVNGRGSEALEKLSEMLSVSITPDEITYIGVLCACTHTGMVDEGRELFSSMTTWHGIEPSVAHYGCMVDLLGRAGHLKEAYEVIKNMPMKPNTAIWGALLGACRVHKDVEMAEMAAKHLVKLEPENGAVYVLLCKLYADCNSLEKLREVRKMMVEMGIKKSPGCSLIEINGGVHEFVAGDRGHPQSEEIYSKLEKITEDLRIAGTSYISDSQHRTLYISGPALLAAEQDGDTFPLSSTCSQHSPVALHNAPVPVCAPCPRAAQFMAPLGTVVQMPMHPIDQ